MNVRNKMHRAEPLIAALPTALFFGASGSEVSSNTGFPFPYVICRGDRFRFDRGIQGILFETRRLKADFSAGGEFETPLFGLWSNNSKSRAAPSMACPKGAIAAATASGR